MFEGKRVLAIIPARGGSKGVPLKNLKIIHGKPMVAHAGDVVKKIPLIDRAIVSTDHEEIAKVAESSGLSAPFRRPEELSGDRISDLQVLTHALQAIEEIDGVTYDVVVLLHPTTPLRQAEHVTALIKKLVQGKHDSVWAVSQTDLTYHPLKQLVIEGESLGYYDEENAAKIIARQQLKPVYYRNGVGYTFTRSCLLEQKKIMGDNASFVVIDEPMISIDTIEDIQNTEVLFRNRDSE